MFDLIEAVKRNLIGGPLNEWQESAMPRQGERFVLRDTLRQKGKTTLVALLAMDEAFSRPGSRTIVVHPNVTLAARTQCIINGVSFQIGLAPTASTPWRLEYSNNSAIEFTAGDEAFFRGRSNAGLIIIDETFMVSGKIREAAAECMSRSLDSRLYQFGTSEPMELIGRLQRNG